MYAAMLEQLNGVGHSGVLQNVGSTGNQLQVGNDKYPHS